MNNPYGVVGTRFTSEEYELLQMGLTGIASSAKENGRMDVYNRCMDLLQRLQQYVIAGQGIPDEMAQSYGEKFEKAMMEQNSKAIIVTLRDWIAALIRLEPDPAKSVSKHITQMLLMTASQAQDQSGSLILNMVKRKLEALHAMYSEKGWPKGDEVLEYVKNWIDHGRTNVENGHDPWAGDRDVAG